MYVDYYEKNNRFYLFNLYIMMKAYQYNKDDFYNFKAIIRDVAPIDISIDEAADYTKRLEYLEKIVQYKFYKDVPKMGDLVWELFDDSKYKDSVFGNGDRIYDLFFDTFDNILRDNDELTFKGIKTNYLDFIDSAFDFFVDDVKSGSIGPYHLPLFYKYYFKIFLVGNRFKYFLDMRNTFCNKKIFDELVFSDFVDLSNGLFEYLNNLGARKDSFVSCCDIIFNSDTYGEVKRKFAALKKACQLFDNGEEKEAVTIVKELDDIDKKDKIDEQVVMYPSNCMNKVEK